MGRAVQTGKRRCVLFLVAVASLCGLGALGAAPSMGAPDTLQFSTGEFTVNCTSTGQLCEPPFEQTVQVPSGGRVTSVVYTAPPGHCSAAKIHVLLDATEIGATGFLEPSETSRAGSIQRSDTQGLSCPWLQSRGQGRWLQHRPGGFVGRQCRHHRDAAGDQDQRGSAEEDAPPQGDLQVRLQ